MKHESLVCESVHERVVVCVCCHAQIIHKSQRQSAQGHQLLFEQ